MVFSIVFYCNQRKITNFQNQKNLNNNNFEKKCDCHIYWFQRNKEVINPCYCQKNRKKIKI
jgi:tRNA A37 N6-isopentenylltransferase MiaA